jgi:hypothetical protein
MAFFKDFNYLFEFSSVNKISTQFVTKSHFKNFKKNRKPKKQKNLKIEENKNKKQRGLDEHL